MFHSGNTWVSTISKLLKDGICIDKDEHKGFSGAVKDQNVYRLKVVKIKPASRYELRATVAAEGGALSNGTITVIRAGDVAPKN